MKPKDTKKTNCKTTHSDFQHAEANLHTYSKQKYLPKNMESMHDRWMWMAKLERENQSNRIIKLNKNSMTVP